MPPWVWMFSLAANQKASDAATRAAEAATGTGEVTRNISGVSASAMRTGMMAEEMIAVASDLTREVETLQAGVAGFLEKMRTG